MEIRAVNEPKLAPWAVEELFSSLGGRSGLIAFYQEPDNMKRFKAWKRERDKARKNSIKA